jgi:hypothetical protein
MTKTEQSIMDLYAKIHKLEQEINEIKVQITNDKIPTEQVRYKSTCLGLIEGGL